MIPCCRWLLAPLVGAWENYEKNRPWVNLISNRRTDIGQRLWFYTLDESEQICVRLNQKSIRPRIRKSVRSQIQRCLWLHLPKNNNTSRCLSSVDLSTLMVLHSVRFLSNSLNTVCWPQHCSPFHHQNNYQIKFIEFTPGAPLCQIQSVSRQF